MCQYLETVGFLEPSAVIRRFLDAQRIHNLTAYLELMHERVRACRMLMEILCSRRWIGGAAGRACGRQL